MSEHDPGPEPLLTADATSDLAELWAAVAERKGDEAADRLSADIMKKAHRHARFPLTGRPARRPLSRPPQLRRSAVCRFLPPRPRHD